MRCNKCPAVMPLCEDTTSFDCVYCDGTQYPDTTDILSEPRLGLINEIRPGQIKMAGAVMESIDSTIPAMLEAGTGVGKSFAYLLPVILTGKRTVISTAKITLQKQLIDKDLPYIQKYLAGVGHPKASFTFAAAYGKNRYACYSNCSREKSQSHDWTQYKKFFEQSDHGLWEDAEKLHLRLDTSLNASNCIGPDCKQYKTCGYIKARKAMLKADVVVTNNWLLGYHYKLRRVMPHVWLLGEFQHVIVDEAHKIEDGIRTAFTNETSLDTIDKLGYRFNRLLGVAAAPVDLPELIALDPIWKNAFAMLYRLYNNNTNVIDAVCSATLQDLIDGLDAITNRLLDKTTLTTLFSQLSNNTHTELIRRWITKTTAAPVAAITMSGGKAAGSGSGGAVTITGGNATSVDMDPVDAKEVRAGIPNLEDDIGVLLELEKMLTLIEDSRTTFANILKSPNNRTWKIDQRILHGKTNLYLKDMPVNIGEFLPDKSITYVSATLAIDDKFDIFSDRVGLRYKPYKSDVFPSPFNLAKQAFLYIPAHGKVLPPVKEGRVPGDATYVESYRKDIAAQIYDLLMACEGDTFVLFTANDDQAYVRDYLAAQGYPFPVIDQMSYKHDALERYRATPKATLLASKSFWEGIDVPGDKLFMVIITKFPFPQQSDPIIKARTNAFNGENPFNFITLPEMLLDLRQGVGRLIRTQKDRGMLVVLDTRYHTKSYKNKVIKAIGLKPIHDLALICRGLKTR